MGYYIFSEKIPTYLLKLDIPYTSRCVLVTFTIPSTMLFTDEQCSVPAARKVIVASVSPEGAQFDGPQPFHHFEIKPQREKRIHGARISVQDFNQR